MKTKNRIIALLAAAVAAIVLAAPAAAAADTFTDAQVAAAAKLVFEVPATQQAMRTHLPTLMNWVDAADTTFSGVLGNVHSPVADITALKAIPATGATARADNQICLVDAGPTSGAALYQFDAASSASGNNNTIVTPTSGTGRWLKIADPGDDATYSLLASTQNGVGASLIGIEDAAPGYFTATTVEGGLRESMIAATTAFTGDSGAGGAKGVVPAPAAGDGAAGKVLVADGAWHEMLAFTGDTGSGGAKGMVPAPATGDAAAGKFLKASGAWSVAMEPVVPLVPHSIATLAGTTGVPEDSQMTTAMFAQIKRVRISGPADGNAHDTTYTIPADALVLDAWAIVATADPDPAGLKIDIGPNGNVDGYLNDVPIDATGGGLCIPVLDGTNNWYASTLCGDLLSLLVAGTNADDRGLWTKFPDVNSGGVALAYQASGAAEAAVIDVYLMIAQPQ